jgi:anti-sigma factor RsiW
MHDCRKTKEDLLDLVFNEVDAEEELRLLEELEACRACRTEYRSMREALNGFDEAAPALLPTGEFWAQHHARIEERLEQTQASRARVLPFWRRALSTSFRIPAPIGIAAAILLVATSLMAIRSFIFKPELKGATSEAAAARVQFVEVPVEKRVVEERVVTRTVYVTKPARQNNQSAPMLKDLPGMTANNREEKDINASRATLSGFQPPSDVKMTVIRGSLDDEK